MRRHTQSLRIVVTGLIAQHPWLGGLTWHYLQYVLGLQALGHDVYYLEDSGEWPYTLDGGASGNDWNARQCSTNVEYLQLAMERFGLGDRWAYRFPRERRWYGMRTHQRQEVLRSADLLINVSGTLRRPEQYREIRRLVYIDSDPIFTQVKLALRRGHLGFQNRVAAHDVHFSFGETIERSGLESGYHWRPTRQPIVLAQWSSPGRHRGVYSTVMSWTSYRPLKFRGTVYAQKDREFRRFVDLPRRIVPAQLELAVNRIDHIEWQTVGLPPADDSRQTLIEDSKASIAHALARRGWTIVDPMSVCGSIDLYRDYIRSSKGEWSVAKNGYVQGRPGWFSERSACYLAAGRPVIVQNTGFDAVLPVGEGILPFSTVDEAAAAIARVESDYARHSRAASDIAAEYFDAAKVLGRLLDEAYASESSVRVQSDARETRP
jgi:hypothetical protein